ncbi:MAG: hypothetical protein AAF685_12350 [Cyanobacteria bacterium P01_C01_bin.89]
MKHNSIQAVDLQTAIAQTTQPIDNPVILIADRYPGFFPWWVWIFLIVHLIKAIAELRNGGDD